MSTRAPSRREWNDLFVVTNGFFSTKILTTACKLGLFEALEKNPGLTMDEVAKTLAISTYGARVLLLGVATVGLIELEPTTRKYFNSHLASTFLIASKYECLVDYIYYVHDMQLRFMDNLEDAIRTGTAKSLDNVPGTGDTLYKKIAGSPELEGLFHRGMAAYSRVTNMLLPLPPLTGSKHVLDVAGGDGTNAMHVCRSNPHLKVTILDLPEICERAKGHVAKNGMAERVHFVAGDLFDHDWKCGQDTILLSHMVEIWDLKTLRTVYDKAKAALQPGGRVLIRTMCAHDLETGGLQSAKSSLYFLALASGIGMCHPVRDHLELLRAAGFRDIEPIVADTEQALIIATA